MVAINVYSPEEVKLAGRIDHTFSLLRESCDKDCVIMLTYPDSREEEVPFPEYQSVLKHVLFSLYLEARKTGMTEYFNDVRKIYEQ